MCLTLSQWLETQQQSKQTNISPFRELHPEEREDVKLEINKVLGVLDDRNIMRNKAGKKVESVNECVCVCVCVCICMCVRERNQEAEAYSFRECCPGHLIEKVMCEQRWKGSEGTGPANLWGKSIPSRGKGICKDPQAGSCLPRPRASILGRVQSGRVGREVARQVCGSSHGPWRLLCGLSPK